MTSDQRLPAAEALPPRLVSIDAYRGFVMLAMVSHSFGLPAVVAALAERGDANIEAWRTVAHQFDHVPWVGCTFWDLIQPSFMFLVGVALAFSYTARAARGQSFGTMLLHAAWRSVALVLLGIFLRTRMTPDPQTGALPQTNFTFEDVVTQIGLGYFFLFLLAGKSQRVLFAVAAAILVGYWALFAFWPLPPANFDYEAVGVPSDWEYFLPGFAAHWNKNANPAAAFDVWFLNLFPRREPFRFNAGGYQTLNFIPSLATMVFGLMAGQMLCSQPERNASLARAPSTKFWLLVVTGLVALAAGYALHLSGYAPLVKRIWTPTWTIYSTGWALLMLAGFFAVIELARLRAWAFPLAVVGANSIAIYCLDKLTYRWFVDRLKIHFGSEVFTLWGLVDSAYAPLVQSVAIMTIFWLILYWMYRRKIFLKI